MEWWHGFLVLASLFSVGTAQSQVALLMSVKSSLNASELSDWVDTAPDPCSWQGISCLDSQVTAISLISIGFSGTLSPAIGRLNTLVHLNLKDNKITGKIPEELGNLTKLVSLKMERNRFVGEIPASFKNLKNLKILSLSQNNLSGNFPAFISNLRELENIQLTDNKFTGLIPSRLFQVNEFNFTGNKLNCGANSSHLCASAASNRGNVQKKVALASIGGALGFLLLLGVASFLLWKDLRRGSYGSFVDIAGEDIRKISFGQLKRFSWRELQLATDDFCEENVLGKGGSGKVYRGVLEDHIEIAVKRMTDNRRPGGEMAFLSEVEIISVAVHKNLLRLIGFCTMPSEWFLVYPFMKNGSVASRLRGIKPGEPVLDWPTRKRVAMGSAQALEYLHEHCNPKIIHRDVKAANVLLDDNFEAVVCDFGLAKLVDVKRTRVTTLVRGTMGHIAPEYLSTGRSSEKTDVFGYGIMLLEIVTGKRAIDFSLSEEGDYVILLDLVKRLEREKRLEDIIDCNLNQSYDFSEVEAMVQIALLCSQKSHARRPLMSEVVQMLEGEGLKERWQEWHLREARHMREDVQLRSSFNLVGESSSTMEAIELSGGR